MQEENTFKIKRLRKSGANKKPLIDSHGEEIQPGSRILKGYWGDWIVFGSKVPGHTLKLKIRMTPSGSKIRLINPLMNPDNNWENKRTSVHIDWGDGHYDKLYKKKINSGRFNRNSPYVLEHNYTANTGDEMWLSITSIEPLVPYGCDIIEMLGQFPYDRYDLNVDRDGHYCGLFGVDQYVEDYPELNKLYGAGRTITKVSAELLDNWRNTFNMNRMFEGWGIVEVPNHFFRWDNKFHPDIPDNNPEYQKHNIIIDTCQSYYRTFANCPNLTTVHTNTLAGQNFSVATTEEMFMDCPKLTNSIGVMSCRSLKTIARMYKNCASLTTIHDMFLGSNLDILTNADEVFDGCSSLDTGINFSNFLHNAPKLKTIRYGFRGTSLGYLGLILNNKTEIEDITGLYMNCTNATTVYTTMFSLSTASVHDNDTTQEHKLKITSMFEGAGKPGAGVAIPNDLFLHLGASSARKCSAVAYDCTNIFKNAVIKHTSDELVNGGTYNSKGRLFKGLFNAKKFGRPFKYDISHIFDGVTINHTWTHVPVFYDCDAIEKADYLYANSKWDQSERSPFLNQHNDCSQSLKSVRGMFAGATINFRMPESYFNRRSYSQMFEIEDFSEFFMNAKYKWNKHPVDYIVCTTAQLCNMDRMFKGSNINTYRPIHWRSSDRTIYDLTDFDTKSFSAPKDWILDGYTDRSTWEPTVSPKPFEMWVNIDTLNKGVMLTGDATGSIDWGDGSTDKGLSGGNMTHIYANPGDYKISVISTKSHQPNEATMNRVFRLGGELPYDSTIDLSQPEPKVVTNSDRMIVNYVGPRVVAVCKHAKITCYGFLSPNMLKYGSNSGYKEGLKYLDIIDPMDATIEFSADFVIVDKTVTMDVEFSVIPFLVGEITHVELTIGKVRADNDTLHVDFTTSVPRFIPVNFWWNCIGHKFNNFSSVKMLDVGYQIPQHFEYGYGKILHPDYEERTAQEEIINDRRYITSKATPAVKYSLPRIVEPPRFSEYMNNTSVYRFHPGLSNKYIDEINFSSIIARAMTARGYSDKSTALSLAGTHDDHYNEFEDEFMTFVLENVDDVITPYNLHTDNTKFASRNDIGTTTVEIIDATGEVDEVVEMVDKIVPLKHIRAEKLVLRIKAKYPVWLSENVRSKIIAVYGIITNVEGDFELKNNFAVKSEPNRNAPVLAPNIRHIGESIFWALTNRDYQGIFAGTKLEVIPTNLFAYSFGVNYIDAFADTPIKRIPDQLWVYNNIDNDDNVIEFNSAFKGCSHVESVFEPIDESVEMTVTHNDFYSGCKTYAFKSSNIEVDIWSNLHIYYTGRYSSKIGKMSAPANLPDLTHDKLVAINRGSDIEAIRVAVASTLAVDPRKLVDKWHYMDYAMNIIIPNTDFGTTVVSSFNYTEAQYNNIFKYLHNIRKFYLWENFVSGLVQKENNIHPDHFMLLNNENLLNLINVYAGVIFNYTPNILFINQWKMYEAVGLLLRTRFDKISEQYIASPTHLDDYLGRPIYIGGATPATRWHARPLDKMLRFRNNWLSIKWLFDQVSEGDVTCPKFTKHRIINTMGALYKTATRADDTTFIDIDRNSNVYQRFLNDVLTESMFALNTYVNTDCRIFHIWKEVQTNRASKEFEGTTQFLYPPKDMFDALTRLTKLDRTFNESNIRDLPKCNPIVREYPYFAARSKVSLVPEHWFKYSGTGTLDIRYAFNQCTGLIIVHKIMDPTITVPVVKYASLENAWSIIGDDDVIFEGVNTKLDGTDRSLVRVIPEEDLFRQTIDIHDERWPLSVKALGMESIGNESVQGDNLFMISWGDGSDPSVVSHRNMEWEDYSHKYEAKGRYQVMILSTQWCCYINSTQDLSSKYTTYSIDGMLQNSTCRAVCDYGLTNMFGYTVEKVSPTMFDKLSDVTTVKDLPQLFYNFKKLHEIPENILWKMTSLENIYRFAMYTPITTLPAKLLSKNAKLKNANSIAERCFSLSTIPAELFANNPLLETIERGFCDIPALTEIPRNLFVNNPNLASLAWIFSNCIHMVMDNTYDNFLAKQTKLTNGMALFVNWVIRQLPPNLLNRCTSLLVADHMFTIDDFDGDWVNFGDARWKWFYDTSTRDTDFEIPSNWLPKSVTNASKVFFFRTKLKSYPSDLFLGNTVLRDASYMFMNTGIKRIHSETFKTMSHGAMLSIERWMYKDKRLGKSFYIHYCPKVVSSAINVPQVRTESALLGVYGTMTEAELFSGVKTDPSSIHSLYVQEFEPATFKLKMTGHGTFITMKAITKSDVTLTDLTLIQWGDGTEDLWEENIQKNEISNKLKHNYKAPGEYTIKVGAKYCLVPIIDELPEAYQVESVVFPEDIDQVKQVSIGGEYGVGDLKINKDSIYVNKQTAEVELSLVSRPYYVGETYTVDVTVEPKGIDVGEQTTVELNIARDTSEPFERLEIGGTLGPMEGYTQFPLVVEMPELQYSKWVGTETFFSRNKQLASFNRSFMNLNYEFRIADKVFWALTELVDMNHCFWNTKLVVEPGFAPDFNKNTKLRSVNSMFRGGDEDSVGVINPNTNTPWIPVGTPLNYVTWKVNQDNYQPFANLNSIVDMGYIHYYSHITYVMTTDMRNLTSFERGYSDAYRLTYLKADFFRTLKSSGTVDCNCVFTDTHALREIQPAADGKSLFEFNVGNNEILIFNWAFAGSSLTIDTVVNMLNKSAFINTTASGTMIDIQKMFSWCPPLENSNAANLKLNIPNRSGTLNMTMLFSRDSDPNETIYDANKIMLYNIKAGAITIAASGSPNIIVDYMFDRSYADATVYDAHKVFAVSGDDSNFGKAKALADKSKLNTLTVMTTTVVPK